LLGVVPLPIALAVAQADNLWIFFSAGLAMVPLAGLMGRATENLSEALGPGIGGLLNATFGNAAELLIALMLLAKGPAMYPLVKASITGSIIGNILLVLGMATLLGGLAHPRQVFNRTYASMGATLLALATIGLIVPSLHSLLQYPAAQQVEEHQLVQSLSQEIAVVLAVIYVLSLIFSLRTRCRVSAGPEEELPTTGADHRPEWNWRCSLVLLLLATAGVAGMSELLAGSVQHATHSLGLNQIFMGVIVIAILGNAAEHSTAVVMALKNKMDLAIHITIGSAIQMALFVAPVLIFASMFMGHSRPMDLHFTLLETVTVILAVSVLALVSLDGETNWMEGVLLLGVYLILALAFYHLPGT
jgi:Ca2+:H+ antiporter